MPPIPDNAGVDWNSDHDAAPSRLMAIPQNGDTFMLTAAAKYCPFHVTSKIRLTLLK
jgi:hypothetical protein